MPKSRTPRATAPTPRLALSIPEFCRAHSISEAFFYKLKQQGEGPREMKVGTRSLIAFESAAEWRRERENATQASFSEKRPQKMLSHSHQSRRRDRSAAPQYDHARGAEQILRREIPKAC